MKVRELVTPTNPDLTDIPPHRKEKRELCGIFKRQIAPGKVLSDKTSAAHDPAFDRTCPPNRM
jgi:hypothetical protein